MDLTVIRELADINGDLPKKLALLSQVNANSALKILQAWGNGEKPLRELWKEVNNALEDIPSI
ncbi:hypothetical protein [Rummeliibacillus stabekisii]|uniref:Uncharacterized protein n=1 Tax=Rummeliibacillus stabekisii TaxID=241244 RepID=A0A143HCW8_9BACL|nr:hypothetical protein [Rummeliibacillus stabekisii]AMW99335.1 hypothetical protein ATY39_07570 [Rummeliibacillus stabekisii]